MKITLLTYGTRGDVQPYAVLGDHLARNGHGCTGRCGWLRPLLRSGIKTRAERADRAMTAEHPVDAAAGLIESDLVCDAVR